MDEIELRPASPRMVCWIRGAVMGQDSPPIDEKTYQIMGLVESLFLLDPNLYQKVNPGSLITTLYVRMTIALVQFENAGIVAR